MPAKNACHLIYPIYFFPDIIYFTVFPDIIKTENICMGMYWNQSHSMTSFICQCIRSSVYSYRIFENILFHFVAFSTVQKLIIKKCMVEMFYTWHVCANSRTLGLTWYKPESTWLAHMTWLALPNLQFLSAAITVESFGFVHSNNNTILKIMIKGTKSNMYLTCAKNGKFYAVVSSFND